MLDDINIVITDIKEIDDVSQEEFIHNTCRSKYLSEKVKIKKVKKNSLKNILKKLSKNNTIDKNKKNNNITPKKLVFNKKIDRLNNYYI